MATLIDDPQPLVSSAHTEAVCPNCGANFTGEYCHQCGQKTIHSNEFSLKVFFGRLLNDITDLESSKMFRTFIAMVARPGLLAREYVHGRRGSFVSPVKLYLTFSALYFLFAWGALSEARGGSSERAARSPFVVAMAKQRGVEPSVLADKIYQRAEKIATSLRFASVLVSGLFLTVLYRRMEKYYVEHLIFSLYYYSFDFFSKCVFALVFIVAAAFGTKLPGQVLNLFYPIGLVYITFALKRVYQQKWGITHVKSLVLYLCETLLFMVVNMIGFIVAYNFV
jgi:hypothetical protein